MGADGTVSQVRGGGVKMKEQVREPLERYSLDRCYADSPRCNAELTEDKNGEWVLYRDVLKLIQLLIEAKEQE